MQQEPKLSVFWVSAPLGEPSAVTRVVAGLFDLRAVSKNGTSHDKKPSFGPDFSILVPPSDAWLGPGVAKVREGLVAPLGALANKLYTKLYG